MIVKDEKTGKLCEVLQYAYYPDTTYKSFVFVKFDDDTCRWVPERDITYSI